MERIERHILLLRGRRVLISTHLADLYGVAPKALMQSVKRNRARFPADFMFQLTLQEANSTNKGLHEIAGPRSHIVTLKRGSNVKYRPYAFTQEGVAMLSSVLRSPLAVKVNIEIMRAFVRLRFGLGLRREALKKMIELERRVHGHDADIGHLFDLFDGLKEEPSERKAIGFQP